MNIALSFCGLCRQIPHCYQMVQLFLNHPQHNYTILLTTWDDEDITQFSTHFPEGIINRVPQPTTEIKDNWLQDYSMDSSNPHKPVVNYFYQLYIRQQSLTTIEEVETQKNTKFDVVVTLRTDIDLWMNISSHFSLVQPHDNCVFIPQGPNFDIFGTGACQDVLFFANKKIMSQILRFQYENPTQIQPLPGIFHPETCQFNCFRRLQLDINSLPFNAFVYAAEERYSVIREKLKAEGKNEIH